MATELDRRMNAGVAALTGEGAPMALAPVEVSGARVPMIAGAPVALPQYFANYAAQHADATFLVSGEERLSYAQVHAEAVKVAHALAGRHGVGKGDRVGIAMRNSPAWIASYMGILIAGGVATLLNGWWQSGELADAVPEVECSFIIADAPRAKADRGGRTIGACHHPGRYVAARSPRSRRSPTAST